MAVMKMSQAAMMMFGSGSLAILGDELKSRGLCRPIIITDKGVTGVGVTAKVEAVIKGAGLECAIWDNCLSDAPTDSVDEAAAVVREFGADAIIGLGGGSSMDTAKAVATVIKNPVPIKEVMARGRPMGPLPDPDLPLFTIPTTSGTGSEVSVVGVLSDSVTSRKSGVVISGATLAIVDPELTLGVPPHITAWTGMDVIAHAIEAITGAMRNPMSDIRGFEALRLAYAHLYNAVKDGSNITAREGMSLASSLAALAFCDSVTTLAHATAQALASVHHLHHGLLCGLGTPPELELFAPVVPERVRKIGEIFGADIPYDATPEQIGKITADKIRVFMSSLGIQSFEQMGLSRNDLTDHVDVLMDEGMKDFSPCPITREVALKMLSGMYDYAGA